MKRLLVTLLAGCALSACSSMGLKEPQTVGEINTGFSYIPVDPLEVSVLVDKDFEPGTSAFEMRKRRYQRCLSRRANSKGEGDPADVMDALPDHTVRMAVRQLSGSAAGSFAPVALSSSGSSYEVIVDSMFADTSNVRFAMKAIGAAGKVSVMSLPRLIDRNMTIEVRRLDRLDPLPDDFEEVWIPVYIGTGLRMTANLTTLKGGIKLTSLPAIAASVDAERSSGKLVLQTLGVSGVQVASSYAAPSELNTTTVQNALVSLGAVKATIYDRDTSTRPRLTGIYNPLPTSDPYLINRIYSALAREAIPWSPCSRS